MVELTKKTKKQLRELMIKTYAKELDELLVALSKKFDAWKNHQIDCWELEELIHKFHNGHAKKLFNYYNSKVDPTLIISHVLAKNLIQKKEIPDEALPYVEGCIHLFKEDDSDEFPH